MNILEETGHLVVVVIFVVNRHLTANIVDRKEINQKDDNEKSRKTPNRWLHWLGLSANNQYR